LTLHQIFKGEYYGELTDYSKIMNYFFSETQRNKKNLDNIIEQLELEKSFDESILSNIHQKQRK